MSNIEISKETMEMFLLKKEEFDNATSEDEKVEIIIHIMDNSYDNEIKLEPIKKFMRENINLLSIVVDKTIKEGKKAVEVVKNKLK